MSQLRCVNNTVLLLLKTSENKMHNVNKNQPECTTYLNNVMQAEERVLFNIDNQMTLSHVIYIFVYCITHL